MKVSATGKRTIRKIGRTAHLTTPDPEQSLRVSLVQLKLYEATDKSWLIAEAQVSYSDYIRIDENDWFGLTPESIDSDGLMTWSFRSNVPLDITLRLADEALAVFGADESADELLAALDRALDGDGPDAPRDIASWRYLSVMQASRTVGGTVIKEGFQSRYAAHLP